jgi:hypothetical protein
MRKLILGVSLVLTLTSCSKPAVGQELAKSACQAWKTAWSNSLRIYIGDAKSQYYDFDAAYDLAKVASTQNEEWQPITDAISSNVLYALSSFDNKLFPDTKKQVEAMNICEKIGVKDVNG